MVSRLALLVVSVLLIMPMPALSDAGAVLTLDRNSVPAGKATYVTVSGTGFEDCFRPGFLGGTHDGLAADSAFSPVALSWDAAPEPVVVGRPDGGAFTKTIQVTPALSATKITIVASCPERTGIAGERASVDLEVGSPPPGFHVRPDSVSAGQSVQVSGGDFSACLPVEGRARGVRIHLVDGTDNVLDPTDPRVLAVAPLVADGPFGTIDPTTVALPPRLPAGTSTLAGECGDPNDRGEIEFANIQVTAAPGPSPSEGVPPGPSPTGAPPGDTATGDIGSTGAARPGPPSGPSEFSGPPPTAVLGLLGVVAALIGLAALGRRLTRKGGTPTPPTPPVQAPRPPTVQAVARTDRTGSVQVRRTGAGADVSIRVVVQHDPDELQVTRADGGSWQ